MKKFLTCVCVLALMIAVGSTSVFAAGGRRGRRCANVDRQTVCDYYNTEYKYVDSDEDGLCDTCGLSHWRGEGCGAAYVDEDEDGICDNRAAGTCQNGSGLRRGRCGGGRGRFCR